MMTESSSFLGALQILLSCYSGVCVHIWRSVFLKPFWADITDLSDEIRVKYSKATLKP